MKTIKNFNDFLGHLFNTHILLLITILISNLAKVRKTERNFILKSIKIFNNFILYSGHKHELFLIYANISYLGKVRKLNEISFYKILSTN